MAEMRLINANDIPWWLGCNDDGRTIVYTRATDIDAMPTIDPESLRPVAEWKLHNDGSGTCSQCKFTQKNVWDYDRWQNYCGVCGARMEGAAK